MDMAVPRKIAEEPLVLPARAGKRSTRRGLAVVRRIGGAEENHRL
jgi:hypothetical protein